MIERFQAATSLRVSVWYDAHNVGAMKSFELLLQRVLAEEAAYEYLMFCDQDDIWFEHKIEYSYQKIGAMQQRHGRTTPLLVYTDMQVVDANGGVLGASFWNYFHLNPKKNRCHDLAMQCNITGCTMIFNRSLARHALPFHEKSVMHDHWVGLIASCVGVIDFIDEATLAYRQHDANVSGGAPKFNGAYVMSKAMKYFNEGEFDAVLGRQIDQAEGLLEHCSTKELGACRQNLEALCRLHSSSLLTRLMLIGQYRLFKHGWVRNVGLLLWLVKMSGKRR